MTRLYDNDSYKQPKKKKKNFHINPYMNYSDEEDSDMDGWFLILYLSTTRLKQIKSYLSVNTYKRKM